MYKQEMEHLISRNEKLSRHLDKQPIPSSSACSGKSGLVEWL